MRQLKHAQSRDRKQKPKPSLNRMERISCEMRDSRRNVYKRQNTKAGKRYEQQANFPGAARAPYNLFAPGAALMFVAYGIPTDHQGNENGFGNGGRHSNYAAAPGFPSSSPSDSGALAISPPSSAIIDMAPSQASVWDLAEIGPHMSIK
jgi:hypothetical protein